MDSPRSAAWCSPRGWAATTRSVARSAPTRSSRSGPASPCTLPEQSRPGRTIPTSRSGQENHDMTTTADAASNGGDHAGTTHPAIDIPDYVTIIDPAKMPLHAIASILIEMLTGNGDLPSPRCVSLSQLSRDIEMQFPGTPDSFHAMAAWAKRFGGTVIAEPGSDEESGPYVRCEVQFPHRGVQVKAYAYTQPVRAAT